MLEFKSTNSCYLSFVLFAPVLVFEYFLVFCFIYLMGFLDILLFLEFTVVLNYYSLIMFYLQMILYHLIDNVRPYHGIHYFTVLVICAIVIRFTYNYIINLITHCYYFCLNYSIILRMRQSFLYLPIDLSFTVVFIALGRSTFSSVIIFL